VAVRLDATTDYLTRNLRIPEYPITIAGWINLAAIATGWPTIFAHYGSSGFAVQLDVIPTAGATERRIHINFSPTNSPEDVNGTTQLAFNTWYHIAYVRTGTNGNIVRVYLNGNLEINNTFLSLGAGGFTQLDFGWFNAIASDQFNGRYANWKMWSGELTQAQIQAERDSYEPRLMLGLAAWWDLLSHTSLVDKTGHGHHLTGNGTLTTETGPIEAEPENFTSTAVLSGLPLLFTTSAISGDATAVVSGVQAAAANGTVTSRGDALNSLSGISTTSVAGATAGSGAAQASISGQQATSAPGTAVAVGQSPNATAFVTGRSVSTSIGSVTTRGDALNALSGRQVTTTVGAVTVSVTVAHALIGTGATSAVGTAVGKGDALRAVTGVQAGAQQGTVTATGQRTALVLVTGRQAITSLGITTVTGTAVVPLSGIQDIAEPGTVVAIAGGNGVAVPGGAQAATNIGNVVGGGDLLFALTGRQMTASLGAVEISAGITVSTFGLSAAIWPGTLIAGGGVTFEPFGVELLTLAGTVIAEVFYDVGPKDVIWLKASYTPLVTLRAMIADRMNLNAKHTPRITLAARSW
jgi:hypothetical protein